MKQQTLETLKAIASQANPNDWIDFPANGRSHRTHIGYAANRIDGGVANIALFETNTNAKRADVLLAIHARNYLPLLIAEIETLRADLIAVLEVCLQRGEEEGYEDEDYRERLEELRKP